MKRRTKPLPRGVAIEIKRDDCGDIYYAAYMRCPRCKTGLSAESDFSGRRAYSILMSPLYTKHLCENDRSKK